MLAIIAVRDGVLPAGAAETAAECGGRVLVASSDDRHEFGGLGGDVRVVHLGEFAPGAWARMLAPLVTDEALVALPGSPDGRDLAPRLAHELDRPLLAGAVHVTPERVTVSRRAGLELHTYRILGPMVVTLQPGVRGADPVMASGDPLGIDAPARPPLRDADIIEVLPPDVATMDLSEAPRIVGGGAGLDGAERFAQLSRIAAAIGASMGATRVITDRTWVGHERQIGTTGVIVDPELYLSFGISGAVQHTSGLGTPRHIVSVNTDPHCPMMQLSDLAVVSDANAVLDELERLLSIGNDDA